MKKKIGLALGSGSARGCSHIGVIEALEEEGFEIDFIAGSSIGAAIGAIYLSGNLNKYKEFLLSMDWKKVFSYLDLTVPYSGLINGNNLQDLAKKYIVESDSFEDLSGPLSIITTDIFSGEELIMKSGVLSDAIRASISLPGIMVPFKYKNTWLADGGLVNPVPSNTVKKMGSDIVIAVDLNKFLQKTKFTNHEFKKPLIKSTVDKISNWFNHESDDPNIFDIIDSSTNIMINKITQANYELFKPDIMIEPQLNDFGIFDFDRAQQAIDEGYKKMKEKIPELKKII